MATPVTKTRLASSLSLIGVHQITDSGFPVDFTHLPTNLQSAANLGQQAADFIASFKLIGATDSFHPVQSSTNYMRRGINSSREPFAGVPGPIITTLEIDRAVLYLGDAMSAFGFLPNNIAQQTRPLMIIENVATPNDPYFNRSSLGKIVGQISGEEATPCIYLNCWIKESRISYDLKGNDQAVFQSLTLDVGRIVPPVSLVSSSVQDIPVVGGIVTSATKTLAQNVSIIQAVTHSAK